MRLLTSIVTALLLCAPAVAHDAPAGPASAPDADADARADARADDGRGTPYVVDKSDNICGIGEPRALTNPSKVDYDALLGTTPEVKRIKRKRIDPESAEGIKLMTTARRKVLSACESVREELGYDSVWREIKRRDRTPIPDITERVKAEIESDVEA